MREMAVGLIVMCLLQGALFAQERRYEANLQAGGYFTKETTAPNVINAPTHAGGIVAGVRFNASDRFSIEGDYDYSQNSQKYLGTSVGEISAKTSMHAMSLVGVFKGPSILFAQPFVLAGGAFMIFEPHDVNFVNDQIRGGFVYGLGTDIPIARRVVLRAEYRGFIYHVPDFEKNTLHIDGLTHLAVPSFGLVFRF